MNGPMGPEIGMVALKSRQYAYTPVMVKVSKEARTFKSSRPATLHALAAG